MPVVAVINHQLAVMLSGMFDHVRPLSTVLAQRSSGVAFSVAVASTIVFSRRATAAALVAYPLGSIFIPLHFFAPARLGGVSVSGSDVNDDLAKRADVLGGAIAVLVFGEILGHREQASIDVLKLSCERFRRR